MTLGVEFDWDSGNHTVGIVIERSRPDRFEEIAEDVPDHRFLKSSAVIGGRHQGLFVPCRAARIREVGPLDRASRPPLSVEETSRHV